MKKLLPFVILLMLLLSGFGPNLPYKVWEDFDQMKIDIGDHFLYPTYLPEGIDNLLSKSWFNSSLFKERAKDPYYGYFSYAYTNGDYPMFSLSANDPNLNKTGEEITDQASEREVIESRTEDIMGILVSITINCSDTKIIRVAFEIDGISYGANYRTKNVADKNTDSVQLEELLKVSKSIIEQTKEVQ